MQVMNFHKIPFQNGRILKRNHKMIYTKFLNIKFQ